jgi:hypothetical protein
MRTGEVTLIGRHIAIGIDGGLDRVNATTANGTIDQGAEIDERSEGMMINFARVEKIAIF